jgi:hypothetical protein
MDEIRLEVRARNNILWHAIFDVWPTVSAFCQEHNISSAQSTVGGLLNLKRSPLNHKGEWNKSSLKLAQIFGILPEDLFPLKLYEIEEPQRVLEISFAQLPSGFSLKELPAPNSLELDRADMEVADALKEALARTTGREEDMIKLRFGLGKDGKEHTYEEIGAIYGLSNSRIAQIVEKGLRKMRARNPALLEKWGYKLELEGKEE